MVTTKKPVALKRWRSTDYTWGEIDLVIVTPQQLGHDKEVAREIFFRSLVSLEIDYCPTGISQYLESTYHDQPVGEVLRIAESSGALSLPPKCVMVLLTTPPKGDHPARRLRDDSSYTTVHPKEKWVFVRKPPE